MEKLEFIKMMLNKRGLSMNDKRRLMVLATKEIENTKSEEVKEPQVNNSPTSHDPEFVNRFLQQFTKKESKALKFTTHIWNKDPETGDYDYATFDDFKKAYLSVLEGEYPLKNLSKINKHLWMLIRNFLVNEENDYAWGEYKLKIGYSKYVRKWMDSHPGEQPYIMPISEFPEENRPKVPINGKVISTFGNIIDLFKKQIQFRDDELYRCISKTFRNSDIILDKESLAQLKGRSFFTDTDLVKNALSIIAGNVFNRSSHPNVKISCDYKSSNEKDIYTVSILQEGSFSYKEIDDIKINPQKCEGALSRIKELLISLADFSVESIFRKNGEECALRINYLSYDNSVPDIEAIEKSSCSGFKYILTFYTFK